MSARDIPCLEMEVGNPDSPSQAEINKRPWKYVGYKDFTSYVASDPDLFAVRRFHGLHTRVILTLQDLLAEKEEQLDVMDIEYSSKHVKVVGKMPPEIIRIPPGGLSPEQEAELAATHGEYSTPRDINNGTVRDDMPQRASLIADIAQKLETYDKLLLSYSHLAALAPAPKWNLRNLRTWFSNNPGAIMESESAFLTHNDELISIWKEKPPLRRVFEQYFVSSYGEVMGLFKKDARRMESHDRTTTYIYSDAAIDNFAFVVMLATTLVMLIAPMWILQNLSSANGKLGVITAFAIVWLGLVSYAANGRPFEKLAVTAGYLAVLVVFLQFGGPGPSK
ncbi:hypothetical protein FOPG_06936 [Fusarium oxysporum f. sp. conglutinans race 2 54008]|nr:hypothetical protein FOPG_06936 [Fusarium oxysporum f. sp. conglutinans race 2 54008]KAG6992227.1 hypothetical protein FocnCong_v017716 [Fusarium oxysporum f. sp. conglutinans]